MSIPMLKPILLCEDASLTREGAVTRIKAAPMPSMTLPMIRSTKLKAKVTRTEPKIDMMSAKAEIILKPSLMARMLAKKRKDEHGDSKGASKSSCQTVRNIELFDDAGNRRGCLEVVEHTSRSRYEGYGQRERVTFDGSPLFQVNISFPDVYLRIINEHSRSLNRRGLMPGTKG